MQITQDIKQIASDTPDSAVLLIMDVSNSMDDCTHCGEEANSSKHSGTSTTCDQLPIRIPKGRKADVEEYAKACNESVNSLVNNLLRQASSLTEDEWKKAPDTQDGGT